MAHVQICRGLGVALGTAPAHLTSVDIVTDDGEQIIEYPVLSIWGLMVRKLIIGVIRTGPMARPIPGDVPMKKGAKP